MRTFLSLNLLIATAFVAALAAPATRAQSVASAGVERFGDWRLGCPTRGASQKPRCALGYRALRSSDRSEALRVQIMFADNGEPALFVSTPWGVRLPPGLTLDIDGEAARYPFEICDPSGCHLGVDLSKGLLKQLTKGRFAKFSFQDRGGAKLEIPVSLAKLSRGYAALSRQAKR